MQILRLECDWLSYLIVWTKMRQILCCDWLPEGAILPALDYPLCSARKKKKYIYIYVICRLGGPYSEKLWPRSWKCKPRAAFSSPRSQFFTIRTDPKPVNNLFIFFQALKRKKLTQALLWPWSEIGKSGPRYEPIRLQDSLPCPLGKK